MSTRDLPSQDDEAADKDEYGPDSDVIAQDKLDVEQDGQTCSICLHRWSNSGDHRLVALKCGHLFGSKCIKKLLSSLNPSTTSCPTCKSRADIEEIWPIYAKKIIAVNTAEEPRLRKQVETLKAETARSETELRSAKLAHRACLNEIAELRAIAKTPRNNWSFSLDIKGAMFSANVLSFNRRACELYISDKMLWDGYGVRILDCVSNKRDTFPLMLRKPIRDMSYSQKNDMLVIASVDGTASLQPRTGSGTTWTVNTGDPLWSCAWNTVRDKEFYLGTAGGLIYSYDCRNLTDPVSLLINATDMSPVGSLCPTDFGLVSCSYASCLEWTGSNDNWHYIPLPVPGPYSSICYDEESGRLVINCRKVTHRSRLHICKLRGTDIGKTSWEVESKIDGLATSVSLTPVTWVRVPDAAWVASYNESDGKSLLELYGMDGAVPIVLPAQGPILSLCSAMVNGNCIVCSVSETRLNIFKGTTSTYL